MSAGERAYQRFLREQTQPQTEGGAIGARREDVTPGSEFEDLFKIMGCTELATPSQLSAQYKYLVKQLHPDKQAASISKEGDASAPDTTAFQRVQRAYEILTDPDMRKQYDRYWASHLSIAFDTWLQLDQHHRVTHWEVGKRKPVLTFEEDR